MTRSALAKKALSEVDLVKASHVVDVEVGVTAVRQYANVIAVEVASVNEPWMLGCVVLPNGVTTGERMATRMLR